MYKIGVYNQEDETTLSGKSISVVGTLSDKTTPAEFKRFAEMAAGKTGFDLVEARELLNKRVRVVTDQMPDVLSVGLTGKVDGFLHHRPDRGYIIAVDWVNGTKTALRWFNRREFGLWLEVIPDEE